MSEKHIDDIFKKGLEDHESIPPGEIWRKIDSRLRQGKRKAIAYRYAGIAAAVVILLGFGGGLMQLLRQDEHDKNYLSPGLRVMTPGPEIADMPAPRQTPSHKEVNDIIAGMDGEIFRESEPVRDISVSRLMRDPETRGPDLPPAVPGAPAEIEYPGHIPGLASLPGEKMAAFFTPGHMDPDKQGRWTAGIMAAPSYSFRSLSAGESGYLNKARFNSMESGLVSVSGRVTIGFIINDRLSVQTGIDFMKMGQSLENMLVVSDPSEIKEFMERTGGAVSTKSATQPVQNSLGEIYTDRSSLLVTNTFYYNLNYLSGTGFQSGLQEEGYDHGNIIQGLYYLQTPVMLRYRLLTGKTGLVASGGLGASFLAGNKVILRYQGRNYEIGETLNVKNFGVSGIAGLALEHQAGNNIILVIEPRLSHFITPVNSGAGHHLRPWSFSLYGGLSYRF